jgi:hypothetical protein
MSERHIIINRVMSEDDTAKDEVTLTQLITQERHLQIRN